METRVPRRYFLIPFVYAAIIAALLYLQFSGTVRINDQIGHVAVSVETPARARPTATNITEIALRTKNLRFTFGEASRVELVLDSGRAVGVEPVAYTTSPSEIQIEFDEGLTLSFWVSGTGNNSLRIRASFDRDGIESVSIPFAAHSAEVSGTFGTVPVLEVRTDGQPKSLLALSSGRFAGSDSRRIVLPAEADTTAEALLIDGVPAEVDPVAFWFSQFYEPMYEDVYASTVREYVNDAYAGWISTRLSRPTGTWRKPGGVQQFDETIMTYALSEALVRGELPQVLATMRNVAVLHPAELTIRSATFIGGIVDAGTAVTDGDTAKVQRIRSLLQSADPTVFETDGLLPFLFDRAPFSLAQGLVDLAAVTNPEDMSLSATIGAYATYVDAQAMNLSSQLVQPLARFATVPVRSLLPALGITEKGLFVMTDTGAADLRLGIQVGSLLLRDASLPEAETGSWITKETMKSIGRDLIVSALHTADPEGFMPRTVDLEDAFSAAARETITPESIYPYIAANPYLPREISLYDEEGPGRWVWTSAASFEVASEAGVRLTFRYPEGAAHHFLVRGIESFSQITMFGIPWKSDPRFQAYTSGWVYDSVTRTLYVKITHRSEIEEILIN